MRRRVLVVFPTSWDERQFAALPEELRARYELVYDEPRDDDVRWDLDVNAWIEARARRWRGELDGVFSSSDYPGALAAAVLAAELALPGAPPASVLRASHKYQSRLLQRALAPAAVPRFALFDPRDERSWPPPADFPCFVKPVKASFSLFARHVLDRDALRVLAESTALGDFQSYYVRLFEELALRHADFEPAAHLFLAEEPLRGAQVTVEGWVQGGVARVLGIVDTSFHAGTPSFARFDYPSQLPAVVQARMASLACEMALAHGLEGTLFNLELFYDAAQERIAIIELNPRLCGQFCDLYAKVDGLSGLALALALACGEVPDVPRRAGPFAHAASVPLRTFESVRVRRAPGPAEQRAVEARFPGTLVWSEVARGTELVVGPEVEDGASVRYGVVNLGARSRAEVADAFAAVRQALAHELEPLGSG
jgi:hypothetical protein